MLVCCPHRGDHKTNRSRPHGPRQCPPPRGKHGDRGHSLYAAKVRVLGEIKLNDRGAAVAGTGKPSASSDKKAGVKNKIGGV